METEASLPLLQEPAIGPYSEPHAQNPSKSEALCNTL